jgi:DNA-binding GntR family transcriptional regulator
MVDLKIMALVGFQTLNPRGVSEEVHDILREKILSSELAPGQRLDVAQISTQLGVSRTPVKDALQRLSAQELITIHPRRGTFVTQIRPDDVRETFEVREALEMKACELAAGRLQAGAADALRDLNVKMFAPDLGFVDHAALDSKFHLTIVESAGNQRLLRIYSGLKAHVQIARVHYRSTNWRNSSETTIVEHNNIVEALIEGRAEEAQRAMQRHIRNSMERLISGIIQLTAHGDAPTSQNSR